MDPRALLLGVLIGMAGLGAIWWRVSSGHRRSTRHARAAARRGYAVEAEAENTLEDLGFTVLAHHPRAQFEWWIDDVPHTATMQPDWLVERHGRTYAVEVKSGARSSPHHHGNRRQLLEYACYFPIDGVLLLDAEAGTLHHIEFPSAPESSVRFVLGFGVGALLGAAVVWLWFVRR